ncbi:MAG: NADH-quinone oxidoreductase subunit H [Candidatus Hecatellales archaeon]|nr:MAG: NADH-quinone oxidoreductase subunit H [Candidatus Hecatellales archaeon]
MMREALGVVELLVFPGFLFLSWLALYFEWVDRKFYAKLQYRYGPLYTGPKGFLQPFADFVKLLAKEDIVPAAVDRFLFTLTPILMLALAFYALFYVPIVPMVRNVAFGAFEGDLILVIFVLTMVGFLKFLAGWGSTNRFSAVGAVRTAFQLLGYEIPLAVVLLTAGMGAGTLNISLIAQKVASNGILASALLPALAISIVCFQAELERIPFDIPEAEQEIVAGWLTEFSGRRLALFRFATDLELTLAAALTAALFLGGPYGPAIPLIPVQVSYFLWFMFKTTVIVMVLANIRALFARLRIDQMVHFSWRHLLIAAVAEAIFIQVLLAAGVIA